VIRAFLRWLFGRGAPQPDPLDGLDPATARIIVGLGNPGPEYADTRHNVGFRVVEQIARRCNAQWRNAPQSLVARTDTLLLVKPLTFMNRSGQAVNALLERLGVKGERCLIVYDDMDLPFGSLRLRERGSPGTHNGMRSIVAALHSEHVARLRIGIGQARPGQATDHVLSEFSPDERDAVDALVGKAADAALSWAIDGAAVAMNRYNKA
jgi:PTH1 family peptidyl-tRNA hydrolase